MDIHLVVFIRCTTSELRNRSVFVEAAQFSRWECSISIVCDETAQDLYVTCSPPERRRPRDNMCHSWSYFYWAWRRKYGDP